MVAAGVTSITAEDIIDERVYRDVTNLFHRAVEMLGDLNVGGDISVDGDVTFAGAVAFESGVVADVTGNTSGCAKRKYTYSASPNDIVLIEGGQDAELDRHITTTPIYHSLILPIGGATNIGSIVIGTIGLYPSSPGSCTISCYNSDGDLVYTHTITSESWINTTGGYWTEYTATIPQNAVRITITGSTHWRWGDVYVSPSLI
jgi:hypothetical protein